MDFQTDELKERAGGGIEVNRLQVPCKRDVTGDSFVRGIQDYEFSVGGRYAVNFAKSYFRVALELQSNADETTGTPNAQENSGPADIYS